MPGNIGIMNFISSMGGTLFSMDGLNADMIRLGFEIYEIPKGLQPEYLEKIIVYTDTMRKANA